MSTTDPLVAPVSPSCGGMTTRSVPAGRLMFQVSSEPFVVYVPTASQPPLSDTFDAEREGAPLEIALDSVGSMGVAADLGYGHHSVNGFQRLMQRFGSSRGGAWMFSKLLAPVDRVLHRMTHGRTSAPEVLAGMPVMMVTTTGRRSHQPRTSPLIAVPVGDTLALLGTNFGQTSTPAWVLNLEADPSLTVGYRDRVAELVARPATEAERTEVWRNSAGVYGGYEKYRERIHGRAVRIFVLDARP